MSDATANLPATLEAQFEMFTPQIQAVLPAHITVEKFKRVVLTAINNNPDLLTADRRSLFNASVLAANDGLLPDGREAALVVFNTKVKIEGKETWIKKVQYMPMVAGIRKRMRNSGEVLSADAYVVYSKDRFSYQLGDDPKIEHHPAQGFDRGEPVGAYAVIKLKNGEVLREVMSKAEIEAIRAMSRAPDSLMWSKVWGEGARKVVLRRCSKAAPVNADVDLLLRRDDELEEESLPALAPPEPRPERGRAPEPFDLFDDTGTLVGTWPDAAGYARELVAMLNDENMDFETVEAANFSQVARLPAALATDVENAYGRRVKAASEMPGVGHGGAAVSSGRSSPHVTGAAGFHAAATPASSDSAAATRAVAPADRAHQDGLDTAAEITAEGKPVAPAPKPAYSLVDHRGEQVYGYEPGAPEAERYFRDLGELCGMDKDLGVAIWKANYATTAKTAREHGLMGSAKALAAKYGGK